MKASLMQFAQGNVCPMMDGRHIIKSEIRERCFVYQSFGLEESSFNDMIVRPHVSFLADSGDGTAAEWEPQYGPIQTWAQCEKDWQGTDVFGGAIGARQHWHFPFVQDNKGDWSQLAVDREDLKGMVCRGDFNGVFDVLMRWASRND